MTQVDFGNILFAGRCNLRCPHCIGHQVDPALNQDNLDLFPLRNLDRFVALLRRNRVRQVTFTGTNTDPQLYWHEARLIRHLRARLPGVQISLHTNGQLALRRMHIVNLYDRVAVSLPAHEPDIYQKMTGSRRVPDLAAIVAAARIPVKVSCLLTPHNEDQIVPFLDRCREAGVRRVALRRLYGDRRRIDVLPGLAPARTYRNNPVYDYHGLEVTCWRFEVTTSTALNLFADGTISDAYLLTAARSATRPASPVEHAAAVRV